MFLIQDGHQAHTRVEPAINAGDADGAIWSLADETPANLDAVVAAGCMHGDGIVQAIDSQLYVAPLADANPKTSEGRNERASNRPSGRVESMGAKVLVNRRVGQ